MDEQVVQRQAQLFEEKQMYESLEETINFAPMLGEKQTKKQYNEDKDKKKLKPKFYSSMSKSEKKAEKRKFKALRNKHTFVSDAELTTPYMLKVLDDKVSTQSGKITQKELFEKVIKGDCSSMEKLNAVLRDRAATEYMRALIHKYDMEHLTPEQFVENIKQENAANQVQTMLNPLLRLGISLFINSGQVTEAVREKYRKIDDLLNREIMVATLTKKAAAGNGISDDDVNRNIKSQIFMVKTLLSCHIGSFKLKSGQQTKKWNYSVANAFSHCSRVIFTMPGDVGGKFSEATQKKMLDSFNANAGFKSRGAATHGLELKRKDGTKNAKELKSITFSNQHGMNVAIGGLGNNGIAGPDGQQRMIRNDGSCGHLFMHFEKGSASKHSGMLIGFESDAYKVTNQMGHTHNLKATGELASSFGGQRCDEIGDKYGGREADLTKVDPVAYTELMTLVNQVMEGLYRDNSAESDQDINYLTRMVSGNCMNQQELGQFIKKLFELKSKYPSSDADSAVDPDAAGADLLGRLAEKE